MQFTFVTFFQPFFADVFRALVIYGIILGFDYLRVLGIDATDITNHMRSHGTERILAKQAGLNFHPGKAKALGRKARHFFVAQARANRRALEIFRFFQQLLETLAILALDFDHVGQTVYYAIQGKTGSNLGRCDFERVGGEVARQYDAVAIQNQAAIGHQRHHQNTVVFRLRGIIAMLVNLQPDKARQQEGEAEKDKATHRRQTHAEEIQFPFRIFKFSHVALTVFPAAMIGTIVKSGGFRHGRSPGAEAPATATRQPATKRQQPRFR